MRQRANWLIGVSFVGLALVAPWQALAEPVAPQPATPQPAATSQETAAIGDLLDGFHQAAADADIEDYFSRMTANVVFLGTDGSERWQGQAFREFAQPHFDSGTGWRYAVRSRNIIVAEGGKAAWFDEALHNDKLGACRGSGVLVRDEQGWKIAQYNLSVPIPNAMVVDVAADISAQPDATGEVGEGAVESDTGEAEKRAGCVRRGHKNNRTAGC